MMASWHTFQAPGKFPEAVFHLGKKQHRFDQHLDLVNVSGRSCWSVFMMLPRLLRELLD